MSSRAFILPRMLRLSAVACLMFINNRAGAAEPMFPKPIHLVREISESIGGTTTRVDQYYAGNKAITIRGNVTGIADYDRQELIEIDRSAGTYSVASFARVAVARPKLPQPRQTIASDSQPSVTERGTEQVAGRTAYAFSAESSAENLHADIAVDRSVSLSRDAFDVVAGIAFPERAGASGALMRKAAVIDEKLQRFGLPVQMVSRYRVAGETVTVTTRVVAIDAQLPPNELVAIPHGARQVEARAIRARQIYDDSDSLVPLHPEH